jgi:hypothetical protein
VKNPTLIVFFLLLLAILIYIFFFVTYQPTDLHYPVEKPRLCEDGEQKDCAIGECPGTSTCKNGVWGVCKWKKICEPGSVVACIEYGCAQGSKQCNECGTGYGPCTVVAKK